MSEPTFRGLGASAPVADVLAAQGIETPFEIQGRVLPDALAGQDVLAKAPTGSGKTLAFGIPLVERVDPNGPTPSALVLVPTRELAAQVGEVLESLAAARGLRVATAYGGVGLHDQAKKADRSHLLVATPGRLEDLANRKMLSLSAVSILVLDEADRMLDMGGGCRKIARRCSSRPPSTARSAGSPAATRPIPRTTRRIPAMRRCRRSITGSCR
jgi:ATP-dependent RNA helicase RhlE